MKRMTLETCDCIHHSIFLCLRDKEQDIISVKIVTRPDLTKLLKQYDRLKKRGKK